MSPYTLYLKFHLPNIWTHTGNIERGNMGKWKEESTRQTQQKGHPNRRMGGTGRQICRLGSHDEGRLSQEDPTNTLTPSAGGLHMANHSIFRAWRKQRECEHAKDPQYVQISNLWSMPSRGQYRAQVTDKDSSPTRVQLQQSSWPYCTSFMKLEWTSRSITKA